MIGVIVLLLLGVVFLYMRLRRNILPTWTIYKIKKNRHNPSFLIKTFFPIRNTLMFSVIFGEGCNYNTIGLGSDAADINKLYGISYGFDPHWNSLRVGWRWNPGESVIEIFWYAYITGKRKYKHIMNVDILDRIDFTISRNKNTVVFRGGNEEKVFCYTFKINDSWIRFKMFPYFGGNRKAPNDLKILIRE